LVVPDAAAVHRDEPGDTLKTGAHTEPNMQNAKPALIRTTPLVLIANARPFRVEQADGLGNEYPEPLANWAGLPGNHGTAVADHGDTIGLPLVS
jgi:hypothetical protein